MHSDGAIILAHENTKKHLSTTTRVEAWDFTFPPAPAGSIPAEVIDKEKTLSINSTNVVLAYYGPSHTDGDLSAYARGVGASKLMPPRPSTRGLL